MSWRCANTGSPCAGLIHQLLIYIGMDDGAGTADCPSSGQSEVQMLLVHDAEAVYTPAREQRRRNLLLAGQPLHSMASYDACILPNS